MTSRRNSNRFLSGNSSDGKHYWLTPESVYEFIEKTYGIKKKKLFDPCPYPKPENFDGLTIPWGEYAYVNPPFGVLDQNGKKVGATAWFRKAVSESKKGKLIFFVFPIHQWLIEAMMVCGAHVHHMGNVKWLSIEDRKPGKGSGPIAMFVLDFRSNLFPKKYPIIFGYKNLKHREELLCALQSFSMRRKKNRQRKAFAKKIIKKLKRLFSRMNPFLMKLFLVIWKRLTSWGKVISILVAKEKWKFWR